jgi:hypothetical protein
MLLTQYAAAKEAGVSRQAINNQTKEPVPPAYFIPTVNGFMVDSEHPQWKLYLEKRKLKGLSKQMNVQTKMIKAVIGLLREDLHLSDVQLKQSVKRLQERFEEIK